MGVPKLFRWLSERYPLCVEAVLNTTCKPNSKGHSRIEGTPSDFELPAVREVFDNLYLDLNSIIHNCSHPSDNATDNTLTTPQIAANIFRYISKIVALIRPRKLLYIAVDGVAPRAKMNQQRSRRFRAASDAEKSREALLKAGLSAPGSLFDSNCISPGTVFMEDLNVLLKYFITQKQSEDTIWRNISVLYSGHDVPGEGEHKIMDFIRTQRANPLHDPATSHCFYGTDADLLLLGLASHERYISVLREETLSKEALTAQKRPIIPERFQLVHINVLREYLELEFTPYFTNFEFKIDRLVDDLLLLMSLVGDDFLPGIPAMGIAEHGLEHIFWVYGRTVAALDDYITDGMEISQPRLLRLLSLFNSTMVVDNEFDYNSISDQTFSKEAIEIANTSSQQSASQVPSSSSSSSSDEYVPRTIPLELLKMANTPMANEILDKKPDDPKENLNEEPNKDIKEDTNEDNETKEESKENVNVNVNEVKGEENNENKTEKLVINRPKIHEDRMKSHFEKVQNAKTLKNRSIRNRYYSTKFGSENSLDRNPAFVDALCRHYLDGICWVLRYYLGGCPSWSWYFPYHYAPYIQELAAAAAEWEPPVFDVGAPVLPFQQLLCVLPSASAALVPKTYRALLTSPDSPVAEYYPRTFETDLNGKRNDWESVVLIPFIDAPAVFAAMAAAEASAPLEAPEAARNRNKNEFLYEYAAPSGRSKLVTSPLPAILPKRFLLSSKVTEVRSKEALHSTLCAKWAKAAPSSDATSGCGATALRGATDGKGFPDLGTLGGYDVEFSCRSVKININPSRNRSAILHFGNPLEDPETGTLARTPANSLFGQRILFNWPYFWEGVVSGLFFEPGTANPEDYGRWADEEELARGLLTESCGIELNSVSALLSVAPLDAVVLDPSTGTVVERIYDRDSDPLTVPYNLFDPLHALPSPAAPLSPAAQANNAYRSADTDDFKFYFAPGKALMCREVPGNGESADPAKPWTLRVVREIPLGAHAPRTPAAAASRLDDERAADGSAWIGLRDMAHRAKISEKTLYRMTGYTRCDKTVVSFMLHSKLSWSVVSGWCRSNPKYGYFEFARSVLDFVLYYKQTFPALFRLVDTEKNPTTSHIVPGNPKASNETLKGFVAWFNTLPFVKGDCAKVPLKTYALSADAIKAIQFENEKKMRTAPLTPPQQQQQQQERVLTVRRDDPNLVHSYPILTVKVHDFNNKSQYSAAFRLGERVMNICNDGLVPIGATGTIIRVKYPVDVEKVKALGSQNPVYDDPIYDILFDEPFCSGTTLGGKCKDFYGYSRNDSQIVPLKFLRASVAPSPQRTSFSSSSSSSASSSGFPMPGEVPPTNSEPQKRTSVVVKKQKQSQQKTDLKKQPQTDEKSSDQNDNDKTQQKSDLKIVKKQPQTDEKSSDQNDNDKTQQKSDLKIVKKQPQTEEKPAAQDDDGKPKQSHKLVIVRKQSLKIERKADPKTNAEDKKQEDSGKQVQSVKIEITRPNRSKPDDAASKKQPPPEKAEEHQQNIVLPPIPQNAILPPIPQNAILPPIPQQQQQQPSGVPLPLSFVAPHKESTTVEVTNVDTAKRLELLRKRQLEQQQLQLQQLQKLQAQRRVNLAPNPPPGGANPPKSQNRGGLEPQRPGDSELTWQQKKFFKK